MSYSPAEIKAAGLDDFRNFLRQVWAFLGLPAPTPVQLDIAYQLQHGPDRMIVQGFRGVGKSWITVAFVLWILFLDPQKKVLVVSANQQLADQFSIFCTQLIDGVPMLQHLKAQPGQRASSIIFDVGPAKASRDPSVKSAGITGSVTGSRADVIIPDDIEVPKNSQTQLLRDRLAELVKEFDAILKPGGRIIFLGTPQVESSLYNKLETRGYTSIVWPVETPVDPLKYRGRLGPYIWKLINAGAPAHTPVEPTRFPREELDKRAASYGLAGYALQFMLDTTPSDAERYPLKTKDLIVMDLDAEMINVKIVWGQDRDQVLQDLQSGGLDGDRYHRPAWKSDEMTKYTGTVLAIDPSGRGKDETGYAIVKHCYGMLFLCEVGGFVDGFGEDTLVAIASAAKRWGVNYIIIEENFGGGMFGQLLKPYLVRVGLDKDAPGPEHRPAGKVDEEWNGWSSTQKEARILDTLQPVIANHKLVVNRKVLEDDALLQQEEPTIRYSFVQQLTRCERKKGCLAHEDRLESVSMAVSYFTKRMERDTDTAHTQHLDKLREKEWQRFRQNAIFPGQPFKPKAKRFFQAR